ncbi:MAG: hypothetical protein OEV94_10870 [Deltaproteobacteria bacterium]|nr:hypothetical protein [Deltaproteobacteria bacterium]
MSNGKQPGGSDDRARGKTHGGTGLAALFAAPMDLPTDWTQLLRAGYDQGTAFFERFNNNRLELAFKAFDEEMKKALFEVLFLLHVNDPRMAQWKFTATRRVSENGILREKQVQETADLYVDGAPHGLEGIEALSPLFRKEFEEYTRKVFEIPINPLSSYGFNPVVSVHSLGSIGTVGHKSKASDLDLQVQFELEPFLFDTSDWSDNTFVDALQRETLARANRIRAADQLPPDAMKDPKFRQDLMARAGQDMRKGFPTLYKYLVAKEGDYSRDLAGAKGGPLRNQLLMEIMMLMKRAGRMAQPEVYKKRETSFRERIGKIQEYIMAKFPAAEIYLFTCNNDDYRRGYHGTTLESKEASGSAYELILNYETLMPGIQLTPMIPLHFVVPKPMNDEPARYDRVVDYIRFNLLDIYQPVRKRLVNLGPTPDMTLDYMGAHGGAVYWEAFKASSGNLPKATLNLFRIEMLLNKAFLKTIIQLIKEPKLLHAFAAPKPEDPGKQIEQMVAGKIGLPAWAVIEMEALFPGLTFDPWWLRYKALKIGFGEEKGVPGLDKEERGRISSVIDLAFALHVRLSDVFTKPGDTRPLDSFREKVLLEFLKRAFPPVSERRTYLEHLFIGEVRSVNQFEMELRDLFKRSLARANKRLEDMNVAGMGNKKEFEIWFHYYQENFEPAANVVQRTIMNHLKTPRGRLQVGYVPKEGWFFKSLQKQSGVGKRFDTFGTLDHLPDEVMLLEKSPFLSGLAHCIINGYYGILNKGTLKESRTQLEFDARHMDMGNKTDNEYAFIRPDSVERIVDKILRHFPFQPYHYMDCIRLKRKITEVMVFYNLVHYGRVSILYRDNLRTWYADEFDHPDIYGQAQKLVHSRQASMAAKPLHMTLSKFFKSKGIALDDVALDVWVNPHSIEIEGGLAQMGQKEAALGRDFLNILMQIHGPKPVPGAPKPVQPPPS